jgi:hypothetical protein
MPNKVAPAIQDMVGKDGTFKLNVAVILEVNAMDSAPHDQVTAATPRILKDAPGNAGLNFEGFLCARI